MKKIAKILSVGVASILLLAACGGGASEAIHVISRENGSGTRGAFIELFDIEEKDSNGNKKDLTTLDATIVNKTDVMLTSVAGDKSAIGYVSLGSLNDTVKAVKIDGVAPSVASVKDKSYSISRPFNIAVSGEVTGLKKDFIDYILSQEGQTVVESSYIAAVTNAPAYVGEKPTGKLVIAGSSSVSPIMEKLVESYQKVNPDATIEIQTSDSTSGVNSVLEGTSDIGMASRSLKDDEAAKLTSIEIAVDGIAVIVHKEAKVEKLSKAEVKAIFTGEQTTWN